MVRCHTVREQVWPPVRRQAATAAVVTSRRIRYHGLARPPPCLTAAIWVCSRTDRWRGTSARRRRRRVAALRGLECWERVIPGLMPWATILRALRALCACVRATEDRAHGGRGRPPSKARADNGDNCAGVEGVDLLWIALWNRPRRAVPPERRSGQRSSALAQTFSPAAQGGRGLDVRSMRSVGQCGSGPRPENSALSAELSGLAGPD
jgi:hypothetical protein